MIQTKEKEPILMVEEYWVNSPLSVARHSGSIKAFGKTYTICDKRGHTVFECSAEADKTGRRYAIEPGEPADLVRSDFIPLYKKLGRKKIIEILERNPDADEKELKRIMKGDKQ